MHDATFNNWAFKTELKLKYLVRSVTWKKGCLLNDYHSVQLHLIQNKICSMRDFSSNIESTYICVYLCFWPPFSQNDIKKHSTWRPWFHYKLKYIPIVRIDLDVYNFIKLPSFRWDNHVRYGLYSTIIFSSSKKGSNLLSNRQLKRKKND